MRIETAAPYTDRSRTSFEDSQLPSCHTASQLPVPISIRARPSSVVATNRVPSLSTMSEIESLGRLFAVDQVTSRTTATRFQRATPPPSVPTRTSSPRKWSAVTGSSGHSPLLSIEMASVHTPVEANEWSWPAPAAQSTPAESSPRCVASGTFETLQPSPVDNDQHSIPPPRARPRSWSSSAMTTSDARSTFSMRSIIGGLAVASSISRLPSIAR